MYTLIEIQLFISKLLLHEINVYIGNTNEINILFSNQKSLRIINKWTALFLFLISSIK